jgi:site-specific recombinase XerC
MMGGPSTTLRCAQDLGSVHWPEDFALWLHEQGRAQKTVEAYLQDVRHYAKWFEGANRTAFGLDALNRTDIRVYFEWQKAVKAAVNSYNRRLSSLRVFVAWARERGMLDYNPTDRIRRAEQSKLPPRAKDAEEFAGLAAVASTGGHLRCAGEKHQLLAVRDQVIFGLMGQAGLRVAEVAGLDIDDLHLERNEIRVRGKGGKVGDVVIPDELVILIETWIGMRPGAGLDTPQSARLLDQRSALVTDWHGGRITTGQIRRRVEMVGAAAGLTLKPHDLRHTYIYRLLDSFMAQKTALPVALDAVRTQARHSDARTTMSYLRASYGQIRMAVEGM